jgi:hypothetical protein
MSDEAPDTRQKALRINVDAAKHGTFAEIGAGQEVARWFFHVGGAAGTVAKTISAYDMTVSDALYGPADRYVSRERLTAMLGHEHQLLIEQLSGRRSAETTFFVFADTMATRSYSRDEPGHGWMGVRFQSRTDDEPSEIVMHVRMLDHENVREQEAIGVLGVNLIYAAFYRRDDPAQVIGSLLDDLTRERVEIDMVRFSGPCFAKVDNRLMSLQLVEQNLTEATMFTAEGEVVQPAEVMYGKPVVVERGSFRPPTRITLDMIERARQQFATLFPDEEGEPIVVLEMTLCNLLSGDRVDHQDFLARADLLGALGHTVLISSFGRYDPLAHHLRRYTPRPLLFAMGVPNLLELFEEKYYEELPGGILEALGRLFQGEVRLCAYPSKVDESGSVLTADELPIASPVSKLYRFLIDSHRIVPIDDPGVDEQELHVSPGDVLECIRNGDPAWESKVPSSVARLIKQHGYFGYRPDRA